MIRRYAGIFLALAIGFTLGWVAMEGTRSIVVDVKFCSDADRSCVRDWISALSGWAAAIAAGVTFLAIRAQIVQSQRFREEDQIDSNINVAATIFFDLSQTVLSLHKISKGKEIGGMPSRQAAGLVHEASRISVKLGGALKFHVGEIEDLWHDLRTPGENPSSDEKLSEIAFRCSLLSSCFATAIQSLKSNKPVEIPILTQFQVDQKIEIFEVEPAAVEYLSIFDLLPPSEK